MPGRLPSFFARVRVQASIFSTWILNLGAFGYTLRSVCSPGLNCHGCPWGVGACPVGVAAYGSAMHTLPVFAIGSILAVGAVAGRLVCAFVCPFGLLQDLLYKIPFVKARLPRATRYLKYAALALLVGILPFAVGFRQMGYLLVDKPGVDKNEKGSIDVKVTVRNLGMEPVKDFTVNVTYVKSESKEEVFRKAVAFPGVSVEPGQTLTLAIFQVPNMLASADLVVFSPQSVVEQYAPYHLYYCKLCPAGTLEATVPSYFTGSDEGGMYGKLSGHALRLSILGFFLILMVMVSRPFCRTFCPLGATYALVSHMALARIKVDSTPCINCSLCDKVCPVDLDVRKEAGGPECIACGDCIKVCPKGGITRTFGLS